VICLILLGGYEENTGVFKTRLGKSLDLPNIIRLGGTF